MWCLALNMLYSYINNWRDLLRYCNIDNYLVTKFFSIIINRSSYLTLLVIQSIAVIIQSIIVRYCINNHRNWGRVSIRCWVHKRHPIPRPNSRAMGSCFYYLLEKWPCYNGTVLYIISGANLVESKIRTGVADFVYAHEMFVVVFIM